MAETHADAYADVEGAEIVAVASPNTADEFVAERAPSADSYESATELLDDADVDAIDVCTPTHTHREFVEAAADREVAVFCEKPIANTIEDARAIAEAVDDANIPFMVGHVLRFFPEYVSLRETVESGGVGTPGVARARRLSPFPEWGRNDWYADRSNSGGVLLDLAIHDLDYLRWMLGPVDTVFARSSGGVEEHAHATLRFESGAVGYVEASWAHPESVELASELEVAGDAGLVEYDSAESESVTLATDVDASISNPPDLVGYRRQLAEFVTSVEEGTDPSVGAAEAIDALRLALAARESVDRGAPVTPGEVEA